jgi:tRNA-Thr(GGU) m(6)t(6)A37 methyltransferase TsaA
MIMKDLKTIGYVKSKFDVPSDPFEMAKHESVIVIEEELGDGLFDIESSTYIDVIFLFHKSKDYNLRVINYFNEDKGVFASRSPRRPTPIGVSTVRLIERDGCNLRVDGLDALNGTPVLDIKPARISFYKEHFVEISTEHSKQNPRWEITSAIKANNLEYLLLEAGKIHGHFCPGLALGVRAATYAMQKMRELSDGMEDLVAITETNNCSADGIQFVTGCSFGNNALIFKDFGKTAFTLAKRDGKGIRLIVKNGSREYMQSSNQEFYEQFRKVIIEKNHAPDEKSKMRMAGSKASFNVLNLDFDKLFEVQEVTVQLPDYAPIHESVICHSCGENTMASRIVEEKGMKLCLSCSTDPYHMLDGHGIRCV